jgi:hypothetical protein
LFQDEASGSINDITRHIAQHRQAIAEAGCDEERQKAVAERKTYVKHQAWMLQKASCLQCIAFLCWEQY